MKMITHHTQQMTQTWALLVREMAALTILVLNLWKKILAFSVRRLEIPKSPLIPTSEIPYLRCQIGSKLDV